MYTSSHSVTDGVVLVAGVVRSGCMTTFNFILFSTMSSLSRSIYSPHSWSNLCNTTKMDT